MRIGIDVGGTFTDIVLVDDQSGQIHYTKVLTTHEDLAKGVIGGIDKILGMASASFDQVDYLVHGTTIGTNALIERKGARTGLLTSDGMRDILEIGRIERPAAGLYDIFVDTPLPLVPRYLRVDVKERVGAEGEVVVPLDEASAREGVKFLKDQAVESIAIAFLFSFRNPAHEARTKEICREMFPEAAVSVSSEIAPEFREFERSSTTVINAYLAPVVGRYLDNLQGQLLSRYGDVDLRIMQASGGCMTTEMAKHRAVNIVNSGPAGGALAAAYVGRLTGDQQVISVDMGGTSFDVGVIDRGEPRVAPESQFEGFPVKIPILDVEAIGAGGGSLAWIDQGGALNVGPESAGSQPGPACYGLGGERPTVTDANLVLGRLNPEYFLGGEMKLYPELAEKAILKHVAEPLGVSLEEAASGIIRVVNANMERAISVNSTEKGFDVREFALLPFGGAGPLHAVELAQDLDMKRVVVPPYAGTFSAVGLLVANTRYDYASTMARSEGELAPEELLVTFEELEAKGRAQLKAQGVPDADIETVWTADLRYEGQSYEISTPVARKDSFSRADIEEIVGRFNELHYRIYAYGSVDEKVEFVNLRVAAIGKVPEISLARNGAGGARAKEALKGTRPVHFLAQGYANAAVYERELLQPGDSVVGPALIEEVASTTVITPGLKGTVDEYGNII
ncbi:MAG TPA: hydantoinase/oxoprolinase family protein, partial [Chloroflexi bacterium]|nr:hydantoinase/oxoprolinase family protein [Chloroflexota bacterium]